MRRNFTLTIVFFALFASAVSGKTPGDKTRRHIYAATRSEGSIGLSVSGTADNPADNLFHVYLHTPLKGDEQIWLSYDLDGVQDYTAVSRSINDQLATGGYFVRKRSGWEHQRERVSASWLRQGDNVIRFGLPAGASFGYRVKNLAIEVAPGAAEPVVTRTSMPRYADKGYVEGFVTGSGAKKARVIIDGTAVRVWKGTFEAIVQRPEGSAGDWQSTIEVKYPGGRTEQRIVRFSGNASADYTFGLEGTVVHTQRRIAAGRTAELTAGGASIIIPRGALRTEAMVSVTALRTMDLPAMDQGMVNVTAGEGGYRFLPHGTKFAREAKLSLKFDSALIPEGYTVRDIRTYFFDENRGHWIALPLDTAAAGVVHSLTLHFTDMIDAVIKVPESPQVEAYNSNTIKGIKAADPGAAVNMIHPPQAGAMGNASLGYAIEIPAGRAGLQPQLNVGYSSSAGEGWMGMGWDLAMPSITIDTRWGVPRFDPQTETETYSLAGDQLSPVAHRGDPVTRSAERQFYPRVEGAFNKIIRHGSGPQSYWWEVTDKKGTRYFYGGDPSTGVDAGSTLSDASGNVAEWALREVLDLHGNFIHYLYTKVNDPGIPGSTVMGVQLYVSKITYTGYNGAEGRYSVLFGRDRDVDGHTTRKDVCITAINGFKQVTADLLRRIDVQLDGVDIRHYEFTYTQGAFSKTLLETISQYDAAGNFFDSHAFTYYNDIGTGTSLIPLAAAQNWTVPSDNVHGGMLTHLSGFTDEASALSGTSNKDLSAGVTVSVGFGADVTTKLNTVGGSFSYSLSQSQGMLAMIDVNGDGLPDKLFFDAGSDALYYRPNLSGTTGNTSFGNKIAINGINVFQQDKTQGYTVGLEAIAFSALMAGANTGKTTMTSTIYFTEANGDQLPDIVKDGQVYFNHIDTTTGQITFTPTSVGTPSPIFAGVKITQGLVDPTELANDQQQASDNNPLQDIVRMWQAPYSGTINVTAPVQLLPSNDPDRASTPADGVRVAVQLKGAELWSQNIGADDYSVHQPTGLTGLTVQKGDRIYFRVGSINNGSYDSVNWAPVIDYTGQDGTVADANGKTLYHFDAAKDFILSSAQTLTPPVNGTVHIGGAFVKPVTTDDVTLEIVQTGSGGTTTIWQQTYPHDQAVNTTISLDNISVSNSDQYSFQVVSPTNIDWANVSWQPTMTFTSVSDPSIDLTQTTIQSAAVPKYSVLATGLQPSLPYNVVLGDAALHQVTVTPQLSINSLLLSGGGGTGTIVFSVKEPGVLLGEVSIPVQNGVMQTGNYALNVGVHNGDQLYIEYHVADDTLALAITNATAALSGDLNANVSAGLWTSVPKNGKEEDIIFGSFYRGWGQFAWNGNGGAETQPINEGLLKPSDQIAQKSNVDPTALSQESGNQLTASQTYDPKQDQFIILVANGSQQRWAGYDPEVFVKGINMSSSRQGQKDVTALTINTGSSGTGSPGIDKVTKVTNTSYTLGVTAGVAGASGSYSTSTSKTLTDFIDMNGDRFPDVVSEQIIQYTDARGGLSSRTAANSQVMETSSTTTGVGLTGSAYIPTSVFRKTSTNETHTDAGTAQTNAGSGKIQITGNVGVETGTNQSSYTYLDMNGDGLPDRINQSTHLVALNLGYGFAPEESWGFDQIQTGGSNSFSGGAGLGLVFAQNSYNIGISLSRSDNYTDASLMDVNGDGLPDLVTTSAVVGSAPVLQVRLNNGNGFSADVIRWTGATAINTNSSTTESGNLAFTIGFTLFGLKFTVNPSVNAGDGMSRDQVRIEDVNGDGYPDFIYSTKDDNLSVALSTIGRTNLLKSVSRPMGGYFSMDYQRVGNTYDMPNSVYALASVKVFDGFKGDGPDTMLTTYQYQNGYFDRDEREFYGFRKVITQTHDAAHHDSVYTTLTETFGNDNFYTKGMMLDELTQSGDGKPYTEQVNTYALRDLATGNVLPDSYKTNDAGAAFVALMRTDHMFYEGQPTPGKTTYATYGYDTKGNITQYTDFGDPGQSDDISAAATYYNISDKYIVDQPQSILVTAGGVTLRRREASIDQQTGDLTQVRQYLADGTAAVTDIGYDAYGNLSNVTGAANAAGQRLRMDYTYDNDLHQFVVKASNSYGYSSTSTFDYRFDKVLTTTDMNNNPMNYVLDNLGRVVQITGPYEIASGNPYTIRFEYHPEAAVPWTRTRHFDPAHPGNDLVTMTFTDGLDRVIQTKKDAALFQGDGKADKEQMVVSGRVLFDGLNRPATSYYPMADNSGADSIFNTTFDAITPTQTTYDVLDRVLTTTLPDGSVTQTSYGFGNDRQQQLQFAIRTVDANGKVAEQYRNVRALVTAIRRITGSGDVWTSFTYDALNQQLTSTDDIGAMTTSAYDLLGRRTSVVHPDQGTTQLTYDLAGNVVREVTANLSKDTGAITFAYDYTRVTNINYPKNPENNVHYTYGAAGASFNRAGRVVVQEDAAGAQELSYGLLGEITQNVRTVVIPGHGSRTYVTQWAYDTWNRLTSMIYPDSEIVTYNYNVGGLLQSMSGNRYGTVYNYVVQLGYDQFESRVFLSYGNGTRTTYTYEPERRRLENLVATTGKGRRMIDDSYTYDRTSNLLGLTNSAPVPASNLMGGSASYTYAYDDLYRLTTANGSFQGPKEQDRYSLAMQYNTVGSITRKTQTNDKAVGKNGNKWIPQKKTTYDYQYAYSAQQPHAATHIGSQTYSYDADGNETGWKDDKTGQRQTMVWDEENRLRSVAINGQLNSYIYDGTGQRVLKGQGAGQTVYVDGNITGNSGGVGNFTVYVNAYLVVKSGEYSNHYFVGSERIATRLEHGWAAQVSAPAAGDSIDYGNKEKALIVGLGRDKTLLDGTDSAATAAGNNARGGGVGAGSSNGNPVPGSQADTANNGNHYAYGHYKNGKGSGGSAAADFLYFYHPDQLGSTNYVTDGTGEVYEHLEYFAFGETFVQEHSNTDAIPYQYTGKELDEQTGLYYYGARYYDPRTSLWQSVDPMAEKYAGSSPYIYAGNHPVNAMDPDGEDWFYYSVDGHSDPQWVWHDGETYRTGQKGANGKEIVLKGAKAVVVFHGSRQEKLGTRNGQSGYINGKGAVTAEVTVYGPGGADDIHTFTGYTMTSDPKKFGAIDEGTYNANYDKEGKSGNLPSHWTLNARGRVREMDGKKNPYDPTEVDKNGEGYKTGIFIHRPNNNGFAGVIHGGKSGISVGCLLIAPGDWDDFNDALDGVKNFKVQVIRTQVKHINSKLRDIFYIPVEKRD